jgi:hypothetical protein
MIKHLLLRAKPSCSDTHEFERPSGYHIRKANTVLQQYGEKSHNYARPRQYPVQQHTLYLDVAYLREKYSAWAMAS